MERFELKEEHLKLLRAINVSYNEYCEFGAVCADPKRPYGNSDVFTDIAKILDITPAFIKHGEEFYSEEQEDLMLKLHKELETALQIVLVTGCFKEGLYISDKYQNNWREDI